MFDVFYSGKKPNQFVHEREADSIGHAQQLCRTEYFWWISYLADYSTHDWDFQPVPWQREYTHVWPSQHHDYSGTYLVPRSGEIKYHFHKKVIPNQHIPAEFDTLIDGVDFDYTWAPHPHDSPYIYVFGNQWWPAEKMPTVEYTVPGATQRKYMDRPQAELPENPNRPWYNVVEGDMDYSWVPDPGDPPYIYVFGNQWWPAEKMPTVEYRMPDATERKYVRWPRADLLPDTANWTVPESVDPAGVDYSWVPDPGDPPYRYQFATQHQKTGGPVYTVPGAVETKYLAELKVQTAGRATALIEIDHLDGSAGSIANTTRRVRYFDNYRDTLVRIAKSLVGEHEYAWVCSSICDYTDFDFTWHPEDWQATMLHVFASDSEKFGDTFFMHVPTFAEYGDKKALLEWYDVNFVETSVPRRPMPVIQHNYDSQAQAVRALPFDGPLALYTTTDYVSGNLATVPLWRTETKTIVPLSVGATSVIVPKSAVGDIRTQLYDYPFIDRTHRMLKEQPLDIVFISNGEPNARSNYLQMTMYLANESKNTNRVHLVEGVNGRVAAYHAAARASTTPWFFAVFAKLEVTQRFDWTWQPDRMQQAKHYIFHAGNPVNGLVYGHQAMIAYNRQLALENTGVGLDFTLDQAHEVVPILSGTAMYAETPWMAWRTAFREALKLRASLPDVENEYRLKVWLKEDSGTIAHGHWSHKGAQDAVEYYEEVKGDPTELRKSYEWAWLATYAFVKRSLTTDQ
jgi:hypothetical protein